MQKIVNEGLGKLLALAFTTLLLSACGGSDTTIIEKDPIVIDDDHDDDHDHDHESAGRLLVSDKDSAQVSVIDLTEKTVLDQFVTTAIPSAIYASPGKRYGVVIQRTDDRVDTIDGGLWQEDHGDHMHGYNAAPMFMAFHTTESRPTHFTGTATQSVIFYDGNVDTATPAAVGVFTEADITNNTGGIWLHYTTHMHGAAQARGEYLLTTEREADAPTTLPDRVALYHAHNDHFDQELVFAETCPGLHGSAQNHEFIAFGCTDGVLVVEQDGDTFIDSKILNPDTFTDTTRIGTLVGDANLDIFVGIAAEQFYVVDPESASVTPIIWTGAEVTAIGYGFAEAGEWFVILDNQGKLTILSVADWSIANTVQAITSNIAALPTGSRFELAFSAGHEVFVSDPIANQIKVIDLDAAEVADTIQLDFTPHKFTWLGIAESASDDHDH